MPGFVTMKPVLKPRGSCSKAMARAKEERGLAAVLSQVRVSPAKKGRRPTDLQTLGALTRSNLAMKLRMKLLGEGGNEKLKLENEDVSNGSELEPSSVRLAAMVDAFLEEETNDRRRGRSRFNMDDAPSDKDLKIRDEFAAVLHASADSIPERILLAEMNKAVAAANMGSHVGDGVTSHLRRHAMRHLRRTGFNAGICKSRWDHSGGFPGGEYEYIDVLYEGPSGRCERIVIDVDFKAQFEIARPTAHYDAFVRALPSIFVGRADQLQWIVNAMSEAVKLSLKKRGMHLPPWRKPEYMKAKWFSPHKRATIDTRDQVTDGSRDRSSEASDVSLVANVSAKSTGMVIEVLKPEEKPAAKESDIILRNRLASGDGPQGAAIAYVSSPIDNNDWHLPTLKAKKSQGPGHAGLASLFRKPVASVQ